MSTASMSEPMRDPMMKSLYWKQFHESKRLLAILTAWTVLAAIYAIGYELGHGYRASLGGFSGSMMLYSLFAAIILAIRTSQGERHDGTLLFTSSLPLSVRRIAAVRIIGGVIVLCLPILIAAVLMCIALATGLVVQAEPRLSEPYVQMLDRESASMFVSLEQLSIVTCIAMLGGTQLLLALGLLGNWLRNQAQIGLAGAVLAIVSLVLASIPWSPRMSPLGQLWFGSLFPQSLVIQWGYGDTTGSYTDHELGSYHWYAAGLSLITLSALGYCCVLSYGAIGSTRSTEQRSRMGWLLPSWLTPTLSSRIPLRFPSRWIAMVWLEARQSVPIALLGLCLASVLSIAEVASTRGLGHSVSTSFLMDLPHSTFIVGLLWSVVVGSALYSGELSERLGGFWRTRPIPISAWFWIKFFVGLAAVLLVLDGTTILVSWNAPRNSPTTGMSWAFVACFPILHSLTYTMAVFGTCLLRRPVIGGLISIVIFFAMTIAITSFPQTHAYEPLEVYNLLLANERAGQGNLMEIRYMIVYGAIAMFAALFSYLAYRAAKPYTGAVASAAGR